MSQDAIVAVHGDQKVELPEGATALDALKELELTRMQIVAARVDGQQWDLDRELPGAAEAVEVEPIAAESEEGRAIIRHSVAHLMAQAVTDLYPDAKWAIGPPIENGFYYDFDVEEPFTKEDLERIEERMDELMRERQSFVRDELSKEEALELFSDQPYKREIIEQVDESEVEETHGQEGPVYTVYRNVRSDDGDVEEAWVDLCKGPHLPDSGRVPAFTLLRTAGAHWRGREDHPMLQRIYGTAWESRTALENHLEMLEEAQKRDHRRLGRELELVDFPESLGSGLAVFLPKGAIVRKEMEDWIRAEVLERGYDAVYTPHIADEKLWETSGHLKNYGDLMFPGMEIDEGHRYRLKPMNCPFHILAYQSRIRSYRDLPLRLSELGTVYRYEKSGVVNGMLRARGFTQDDSHIFCRDDQVVDEVVGCIHFARDLYRAFGLGEPSRVAVSTRPEGKSIGTAEQWARGEEALKEACAASGYDYVVDEGEGAFYGPKIDIHATDALGREWQLTTIQVDFNLPELFDVTYVGEDGGEHRPFMVHRALFGSIERFFAVLLESTAGAFPTWLAPVQTIVLPVAGDFLDYARSVAGRLEGAGVRVEVDDSDDTLGNMVRKAQTAKIPYALIVGSDEEEAGTVSIRPYSGDQRKDVPVGDFVDEVVDEIGRGRAGEMAEKALGTPGSGDGAAGS